MKEAFEKIKDFLKSKFDYCAEQAGMNLDAECGSEIASYFRERKELYLDRANIYGEVMREIEKVEAEYNNIEDFTDHLLNMGLTKGYAKGIDDLIAKAKEYYERYGVTPSQMALKELGRILKGANNE